MKHIWDRSKRKWVLPRKRHMKAGPAVLRDLPAYMSPLGTGVIEGRSARREDMKRGDSREVDPSERPETVVKTSMDADRERAELATRPQYEMSERDRERLMKGD